MLYYRNYIFFYNIVYKDILFTHKRRRKNFNPKYEDFNISFYLYKIVKQLLYQSNVGLVKPFI